VAQQAGRGPGPNGVRSLVRVAGALSVAFVMLAGMSGASLARENKNYAQGLTACFEWCKQHNNTLNARHACESQCEKYWACNASDATKTFCEMSGGTWAGIQATPGGTGTPGLRRNLPLSPTPLTPAQ